MRIDTRPSAPFLNVGCEQHTVMLSQETGLVETKTLMEHRACTLTFKQGEHSEKLTMLVED